MKNFKEQKGITLVALVVTIIVLLILAGVTILYVLGDDGIFGQATDASKNTRSEVIKEIAMTAVLQTQADVYDPNVTTITVDSETTAFDQAVNAKIKASGASAASLVFSSFTGDTGVNGTGDITFDGKTYTVTINTTNGTFTAVEKTTSGD